MDATIGKYTNEKINDILDYEIIRLTDKPEMKEQAAQWFHERVTTK